MAKKNSGSRSVKCRRSPRLATAPVKNLFPAPQAITPPTASRKRKNDTRGGNEDNKDGEESAVLPVASANKGNLKDDEDPKYSEDSGPINTAPEDTDSENKVEDEGKKKRSRQWRPTKASVTEKQQAELSNEAVDYHRLASVAHTEDTLKLHDEIIQRHRESKLIDREFLAAFVRVNPSTFGQLVDWTYLAYRVCRLKHASDSNFKTKFHQVTSIVPTLEVVVEACDEKGQEGQYAVLPRRFVARRLKEHSVHQQWTKVLNKLEKEPLGDTSRIIKKDTLRDYVRTYRDLLYWFARVVEIPPGQTFLGRYVQNKTDERVIFDASSTESKVQVKEYIQRMHVFFLRLLQKSTLSDLLKNTKSDKLCIYLKKQRSNLGKEYASMNGAPVDKTISFDTTRTLSKKEVNEVLCREIMKLWKDLQSPTHQCYDVITVQGISAVLPAGEGLLVEYFLPELAQCGFVKTLNLPYDGSLLCSLFENRCSVMKNYSVVVTMPEKGGDGTITLKAVKSQATFTVSRPTLPDSGGKDVFFCSFLKDNGLKTGGKVNTIARYRIVSDKVFDLVNGQELLRNHFRDSIEFDEYLQYVLNATCRVKQELKRAGKKSSNVEGPSSDNFLLIWEKECFARDTSPLLIKAAKEAAKAVSPGIEIISEEFDGSMKSLLRRLDVHHGHLIFGSFVLVGDPIQSADSVFNEMLPQHANKLVTSESDSMYVQTTNSQITGGETGPNLEAAKMPPNLWEHKLLETICPADSLSWHCLKKKKNSTQDEIRINDNTGSASAGRAAVHQSLAIEGQPQVSSRPENQTCASTSGGHTTSQVPPPVPPERKKTKSMTVTFSDINELKTFVRDGLQVKVKKKTASFDTYFIVSDAPFAVFPEYDIGTTIASLEQKIFGKITSYSSHEDKEIGYKISRINAVDETTSCFIHRHQAVPVLDIGCLICQTDRNDIWGTITGYRFIESMFCVLDGTVHERNKDRYIGWGEHEVVQSVGLVIANRAKNAQQPRFGTITGHKVDGEFLYYEIHYKGRTGCIKHGEQDLLPQVGDKVVDKGQAGIVKSHIEGKDGNAAYVLE